MNFVTIKNFLLFEKILKSKILITGNSNFLELEKETKKNMWSISISRKTAKTIDAEYLINFIDRLIENRKEQIEQNNIKIPVNFYLWFDEQAGQLRFNLISGCDKKLPFGCSLQLVDNTQEIIKDFLASNYINQIPYQDLETIDKEDLDEDNDVPYTLKVFQICIIPKYSPKILKI